MTFRKFYFGVFLMMAVFSSCISSNPTDTKNTQTQQASPNMKNNGGFFVASFAPEGVIPARVNFPSIQIQFSEPVVALKKLGEPMAEIDVVEITPPIKGVFRWYGTGLLSFDCEEALIPQKLYTAHIKNDLKSIHGSTISGQTEFVFHTEEIRLTNIEPGFTAREDKKLYFNSNDIPPEYASDIALTFSNNVNANVISKFISITDKAARKKYNFTAEQLEDIAIQVPIPLPKNSAAGEGASASASVSAGAGASATGAAQTKRILLRLSPSEKFPRNTEIEISLAAGAVPDTDCYATSEEQTRTFHTLRPFEFTSASGTSTLYVSFNHRISEDSLEKIRDGISFKPDMKIPRENISVSYNSITVKEIPVEYGDSYSFSLAANCVTDIYGQAYGKKISEKIEVPDADSYANFKNGAFQILEAQFAPRLAFEHQNIYEGSYYSLTPIAGVTQNVGGGFGYGADNSEVGGAGSGDYSAGNGAGEKITVALPASYKSGENKNRRVIESVDLSRALEKTESGYRGALKFEAKVKTRYRDWRDKETESETTTAQYIQVTDLGVTFRHAYNKIVVLVASLATGKPVANTKVSVIATDNNFDEADKFYEYLLAGKFARAKTATTDSDGLAVIEYSNNETAPRTIWLEAATQNDRVVVGSENYYAYYKSRPYMPGSTVQEGVPVRSVMFMYSDRALYRPGETATIKTIDRTLTAGSYGTYTGNYEITFTNSAYGNRRVIYKTERGTMSANGTCSVEWKLPEDLSPGTYFIEYVRADGSGEKSRCVINVQFFERLRFQASATIPEIIYFRGDSLSAEIEASYLGGGALAGAAVNADWSRDAIYFAPQGKQFEDMTFGPLQGWSYDRFFYADDEYVDDSFYENTGATLSQEGKARISVASGTEKKSGSAYKYFLEAQVTDAGNQMIATRASAIVHPASFYVGLSRPLNIRGFAKKGDKIEFNAALATPEGEYPAALVLPQDKNISYELSREVWEEIESVDEYGYTRHDWKRRIETESTGTLQMPPAPSASAGASGSASGRGSPSANESTTNDSFTKFSVTPQNGGSYTLTLRTKDAQNRDIITQQTFYVSSSEWLRSPNRDATVIELTPDKQLYDVGDTAHIMMSASLEKGRYLLTVEREGIVSEKVFTLNEQSNIIDVAIEEKFLPVAYITVSSYSNRNGETASDYDSRDEHKPQAVAGSTVLHISPESRKLDINVATDKSSYKPGSDANISVTATKDGSPVPNAEITLMVVDRGVIDLIDYHVQNPLEYFYNEGNFQSGTSGSDSRNLLIDPVTYGTYSMSAKEREMFLYENRMYKSMAMASGAAAPEAAMMMDNAVMMAEEAAESEADSGDAPQVRKDFRATAVYITLTTDANGKATTSFKLPDSLTEYRITAIGAKTDIFGMTEESLVAANPISVRDVEPRILRPGDEGEVGVVITNIGDSTETVSVSLDVFSGLERTGYKPEAGDITRTNGSAQIIDSTNNTHSTSTNDTATRTVTVSSGETATVMFKILAKEQGWITLGFTAKANGLNEVIYKPLEIEKPYIYETVTTVGEVADGESRTEERIVLPSITDDGKGSLFIQLDATRLGTLTSAIDYVFHYPYGCLEQRSSAVMPLISFGEYISVFGLESEVKNPHEVVAKEIESWAAFQKSDGGFPYWHDSRYSSFAVSLRIAEIIALAKEHNVAVSNKLNINKLCSYIESEVAELEKNDYSYYPLAYSYYVLAKLGRNVSTSKLAKIISNNDCGISEYAFAGLAALHKNETSLAHEAAKQIKNRMALTPRGASFQTGTPHWSWYYYNGNAERYALALSLFSQLDASDVYVSHTVYELLEMQKLGQGRWQSTATTSRVLMAIETYIKSRSLDETDFTAQALLDGEVFAEGRFKGANAEVVSRTKEFSNATANAPLANTSSLVDLSRDKELPLVFTKDGKGTLFYTVSMRYALPAPEQNARDEGICVYTEITDARTGQIVTGDRLESGKIYKQKVFVSTPKERTYVALRVPVAAGAEILNPAFTTTATPQAQAANDGGAASTARTVNATASVSKIWRPYGITHQDIYDAEIQCFWDYLPQGMQEVEFMFRAVRDGSYNTVGAQAECMYEPEIFGRTDGKVWIVE